LGHSRAEKADSRERILDAAARQIRQGGLESVSIADLMKAANLTHGGFYGHFPSRAALIAAALERALERGEASFIAAEPAKGGATVKSIVNRYLSPAHRDNTGEGCAIAALAGDVGRSEDEPVRERMAQRVERNFTNMAEAMGGGPQAEQAAVAAWCGMIGAIALSRVFQGTDRSDQILRLARQSILDLEANVRAAD
jgi:TetR/AcrR family transcriptional repressor of nem operon